MYEVRTNITNIILIHQSNSMIDNKRSILI